MKVYYSTEIFSTDKSNDNNLLQNEFSENDTLEKIINKIHEQSQIPKTRKITLDDDRAFEIIYDHYYFFENTSSKYHFVDDYTKKINELSDFSKDKELTIIIDRGGLVN